nr:MAG TPA: hypothetical protein [Caudoviricetes sp.]
MSLPGRDRSTGRRWQPTEWISPSFGSQKPEM